MKRNTAPISPLQCRVLSLLAVLGEQSSTELARVCDMSRATFYVLASRLAGHGYVRRRVAVLRGHNGRQTLYKITVRGGEARKRFAAECGLRS
ncbi:MAG: hypothetical protein JWQ03_609 [Variovorax sp.]|nr:hypothetical protein [Variovorax sp.]